MEALRITVHAELFSMWAFQHTEAEILTAVKQALFLVIEGSITDRDASGVGRQTQLHLIKPPTLPR
jgi:hypothetical protein